MSNGSNRLTTSRVVGIGIAGALIGFAVLAIVDRIPAVARSPIGQVIKYFFGFSTTSSTSGSPIHLAGGSWRGKLTKGDWNGGFGNCQNTSGKVRGCSTQSPTDQFQFKLSNVTGGPTDPSATTSGWRLDVYVQEGGETPAASICTSPDHVTCGDPNNASTVVAYVVNDPKFNLQVRDDSLFPIDQLADLVNSDTCADHSHECVTVTKLDLKIGGTTNSYNCPNHDCKVKITPVY